MGSKKSPAPNDRAATGPEGVFSPPSSEPRDLLFKVSGLNPGIPVPARLPGFPIATLEGFLAEDALKKILDRAKTRLVKQISALFEMENTDLTFQEEALSVVARKAIDRRTGRLADCAPIMRALSCSTRCSDLPGLAGSSRW